MADNQCPKCGARVSATDVQCLECGVDLLEARRKERQQLQEQSVTGRTGKADEPQVAVRSAASAGRAAPGESSKETRLKVFDKQHAETLRKEAASMLLLGILTTPPGLILGAMGVLRLKAVGWGEVISLRPGDLQSFGGFVDPRIVAVVLTGVGLGALLAGVGLLLRWAASLRAVRDVERGEKPEIVGLNAPIQIGLLLVAVCLAPAALVMGILLRFSSDSDIAGFGGTLIWLSLAVVAILGANIMIGAIAGWAAANGAGTAATGAATPNG